MNIPVHEGKCKYVILYVLGASVNLKDRAGETAVLLAAAQGYSDIIKELAYHKADVDMATTNGRVPLIGKHDAWLFVLRFLKC